MTADPVEEAKKVLRSFKSAEEVAKYPVAALLLQLAAEVKQLRRWQLSCAERAAIDRVMNRMSVLAEEGRVWPELETFRQMVARFPISYEQDTEKCSVSHMIGAESAEAQ